MRAKCLKVLCLACNKVVRESLLVEIMHGIRSLKHVLRNLKFLIHSACIFTLSGKVDTEVLTQFFFVFCIYLFNFS
jgi:hypothetical protein